MQAMRVILVLLLLSAPAAWAASAPEHVLFEARPGAVHFSHAQHQGRAECTACHHGIASAEAAQACRSCHGVRPKAPGAKEALHASCKGCHEKTAGPVQCKACHSK